MSTRPTTSVQLPATRDFAAETSAPTLRAFALVALMVAAGCGDEGGASDAGPEDAAVDASASCDNGARDGDESDVDCGGSCTPCPQLDSCRVDTDCVTNVCGAAGVCLAADCAEECGGSCDPCAAGADCSVNLDCASTVCVGGVCAPASCANGARDEDESDVDCGGSCAPCAVGGSCREASDCASFTCRGEGICRDGCFAVNGVDCAAVQITTLQGPELAADAEFGAAVAMRGERLVVGAPGRRAVYVYARNSEDPTGWSLEHELTPTETEGIARFGATLALGENTLAVGAPFADVAAPGGGAAFVFRFDGERWTEEARLVGSTTGTSDRFGWALALEGERLVVGAPHLDFDASPGPGAVTIYERAGGVWSERQVLADEGADDHFGAALALLDQVLVVGVPDSSSDVGRVDVFRAAGGVFTRSATLEASNANADDAFGGGLELVSSPRGSELVVGARGEGSAGAPDDNSRNDSGAAYVFHLLEVGEWSEDAYLKPSVIEENMRFGGVVAMVGDLLWVGAQDPVSAGVPSLGSTSDQAGALFGFRWSGAALGWREVLVVKPPESIASRKFGTAVAVDATRLVVGVGDGAGGGVVWTYDFTRPISGEVCDGFDNDGDGDVDETFDECGEAGCVEGLCL